MLKYFSYLFELELILLDDLYDGENLWPKDFISRHFVFYISCCIVLELINELIAEFIEVLLLFFGDLAGFFPFFSLLFEIVQLLFQEFHVSLIQVVIVIG